MRHIPVLTFLAVSLSGCASVSGFPAKPEKPAVIESRREAFFGAKVDAAYLSLKDPEQRRLERDRLVRGKIRVLADRFQSLERALSGSGNTISLGGDLVVLALNGLAATTGGSAAKSALSAASAGIIGAQGAINKDIYFQRTLPALIAQMQANFEQAKIAILLKLAQSDAAYPLDAAEIDIQRLEDAGSVGAAVSQITQHAETLRQAAELKLDTFRALTSSTGASAQRLQAWLMIGKMVNRDHYDALQLWLNRQPEGALHDLPPVTLLGDDPDDQIEAIRLRALADPALQIP